MFIKIPKEIKVAGYVYKVVQNYHFKDIIAGDNLQGISDPDLLEIRLSGICPSSGIPLVEAVIQERFIHELLHCIDTSYNAGKLDEETVERLGEGLYQVLKDNDFLKKGIYNDYDK